MRISKVAAGLLLLLVAPGTFAQSTLEESTVIETALKYHFDVTLPYVDRWIVASRTEPLRLTADAALDASRGDYVRRNTEPVSLSGVALPERTAIADLSLYSKPDGFDWEAFNTRYEGQDTYTARVARPGFSDETHAVVRVDVWNSAKLAPLTSAVYLAKSEGSWRVVGGISPAGK